MRVPGGSGGGWESGVWEKEVSAAWKYEWKKERERKNRERERVFNVI